MALTNNNVQNVKFLRNQTPFASRELALAGLTENKGLAIDGSALLARYSGGTAGESDFFIKTLVAFVADDGTKKHLTVFDVDGASADVEALKQEMHNTFGTGVTSENTATAQLEALSGSTFTPGTSSSADTSVEGAKAYAYDLIGTLDYTDTAATGSYVSEVNQVDGKISVNRVVLPSSADSAVAKNVVIAVSEDKGQIEVTRGEISSSAGTIVLTDNADGGINFEVNIDNDTIVQDETSKKLKVASAALTQYVGDGKTIEISAADANNNKTVSTLLTLSSVTPSSTTVKEEYALKNASGETIGSTIKIYKDSSLVSIELVNEDPTQDPPKAGQFLKYTYIDASGATQSVYVDVSALLVEAEFESGVTANAAGVVHGVVDPTSEKDSQDTPVDFLTVGANGFKISGIKDEIDRQLDAIVDDLDATVGSQTVATGKHVAVEVVEENGVLTALTVTEDNIANADDLAELSGKTVTALTSTNGSITASIDDAAGCKTYDIETDASKIKMSGFTADTSDSAFSAITTNSSVSDAVNKIVDEVIANEEVTAQALNDLDGRLDVIESGYVETVKVNNVALSESNNAVNVQISGGTTAASSANAVVVDTDSSTGAITISLGTIDCGTY